MEKTNLKLTQDVSILQNDVSTLQLATPTLLSFEPSVGTISNHLDSYIDDTNGRLFLNIDASWVSYDVSIL